MGVKWDVSESVTHLIGSTILTSLHRLWVAVGGLTFTSACHFDAVGGASEWVKTENPVSLITTLAHIGMC